VSYRQNPGQDHHALIKETEDLWRSVFEGNHETSPWFRQEVEKKIEQFVTTEDQNILMLMQNTVRYCLLRLYLAAGSSLGDAEQNDAIKTHLRRAAANGQDPDEDSWSTMSIYALAMSTTAPSASAHIPLATARTAPARAARGRPPTASGAASRATRAVAAQATADGVAGSSGAEDASAGTARADATTGGVEEDPEEEVTDAAASAFSQTQKRSEQVMSLLTTIQANDPEACQTHLLASKSSEPRKRFRQTDRNDA
jgi:hypothetical protein